ncbi:Autophagy-related protein 27 [Smittium mucronatum]|uniref:Autophagy-related protein 27 n=1 Tax=Smittium mucronatum TaxID=133383 RepID=A0A1R0GZE4_9FUNG|nr:Autophagy-related protein 27 [Smittium mucronatum]
MFVGFIVSSSLAFLPSIILAAAFNCKEVNINGTIVDISLINKEFSSSNQISTPPSKSNILYTVNPCQVLKQNDALPIIDRCDPDSWGCRTVTNIKNDESRVIEVTSLASQKVSQNPLLFYQENATEKSKQVFWEMGGSEFLGEKLKTRIELVCKNDEERLEYLKTEGSTVYFKLLTKAICQFTKSPNDKTPEAKPPKDKTPEGANPEDPSKDKDSGFGIFSFFYYLIIVGFIVYFIVGCVYNKVVNNETGLNMIPNKGKY